MLKFPLLFMPPEGTVAERECHEQFCAQKLTEIIKNFAVYRAAVSNWKRDREDGKWKTRESPWKLVFMKAHYASLAVVKGKEKWKIETFLLRFGRALAAFCRRKSFHSSGHVLRFCCKSFPFCSMFIIFAPLPRARLFSFC